MEPVLYRKRLIPDECIELKDDEIVRLDDRMILTRWKTLKPRRDFSHGVSCYFLDKGIKVSKFMKEDGELCYWYCDVIKTDYSPDSNSYLFTDLLADVIVMPDGFVKVLDLDELAEATEKGMITGDELTLSLRQLNGLLELIYSHGFEGLKQILNDI